MAWRREVRPQKEMNDATGGHSELQETLSRAHLLSYLQTRADFERNSALQHKENNLFLIMFLIFALYSDKAMTTRRSVCLLLIDQGGEHLYLIVQPQ